MSTTSMIARHALTDQPLRIVTRDGLIESSTPTTDNPGDTFIVPSFCDIQINGCLGVAFTSRSLTIDGIRTVTQECQRHGIGQYLPTIITSDFETIRQSFQILTKAIESDPQLAKAIPGFHLEGPYLSADDGPRGAHPKEHIRDPEWDEFQRWQDAANGKIRILTIAPERTGAIPFIEKLTANKVVVAIGHTAASSDQIHDAVSAGAKISTHLGNGCASILPRHDNPIWEQLAADELFASLITDGHHLPTAVLKSLIRGKTPSRIILTCDASPLAWLVPGRYSEWGQEFEVQSNGKIVVPGTPYLAGSGVFTDHCVSHLLNATDVLLAEAIQMASIQPRKLLNIPIPEVAVGTNINDMIIFKWKRGESIQLLS